MTGSMLVQEPVQATIWHCLNHYCFKDATFLAERLLAEVDSEESLYLLATCYYRNGKVKHAYSTLQRKGAKSAQCRYLLAKCCLDLNKFAEAEIILLGSNIFKQKSLDEIVPEFGDVACFVLLILGEIYTQTERLAKASEALRQASKLNPFLWSSFETRCHIGDRPNPGTVFQLSHLENFASCHGSNPLVTLMGNQQQHLNATGLMNKAETVTSQVLSKSSTPYSLNSEAAVSTPLPFVSVFHHNVPDITPEDQKIIVTGPYAPISSRPVVRIRSMLNYSLLSPSFGVLPLESSCSDISQTSLALMSPVPGLVPNTVEEQQTVSRKLGMRKDWGTSRLPSVFSQSGNTVHLSSTPGGALTSALPSPQGPIRRSSRLFSSSNSVKENNKAPSKSRSTTTKSPLRKTKGRMTRSSGLPSITDYSDLNEKNRPEKSSEREDKLDKDCSVLLESKLLMGTPSLSYQHISQHATNLQKQSAEGLMDLMRAVGEAYLNLAQYDCRKAIEKFNDLPPKHLNTGWVLSQLGKAHFELAQFQQCIQYFEQVRDVDPSQTEAMEYYSVSLWHLHKEVALSTLAQEMISEDKNSASTWCCAGNCFSLQKEHDAAIKFFQRAIQVNPRFPYAYTLLGHEYILTEEMDKAMNCFRNAIRIDSRHYNAWCGIGMIYYKQERYEMAELNYRKALSIHSQSSIIMCHMGVVLNALQRTDKALQMLNKGLELDPRHPLCKFHRASIYFANERFEEALSELDELKHIVPREALVYFLMGKVHKKLGNTHLALAHFSWAMDLDPKGANHQIKEAIDPVLSRLTSADDPLSNAIALDSTVEEEATPGNLQNSALTSQESLELPQIPLMDSDESF